MSALETIRMTQMSLKSLDPPTPPLASPLQSLFPREDKMPSLLSFLPRLPCLPGPALIHLSQTALPDSPGSQILSLFLSP